MAMDSTASKPIRIVIADDHQMFREALRLLLAAEHDMTVVGESATAEGAVSTTRQYQPDILLLDVAMPKVNGVSVLDQIAAVSEATRVIMVTGAIDDSELLRALHLGARGVVLKDLEAGLCDFPYEHEGRIVYLCWKLGEEKIGWWHEVAEGFAGRQILDESFE